VEARRRRRGEEGEGRRKEGGKREDGGGGEGGGAGCLAIFLDRKEEALRKRHCDFDLQGAFRTNRRLDILLLFYSYVRGEGMGEERA
jgi:hypothetical protein